MTVLCGLLAVTVIALGLLVRSQRRVNRAQVALLAGQSEALRVAHELALAQDAQLRARRPRPEPEHVIVLPNGVHVEYSTN